MIVLKWDFVYFCVLFSFYYCIVYCLIDYIVYLLENIWSILNVFFLVCENVGVFYYILFMVLGILRLIEINLKRCNILKIKLVWIVESFIICMWKKKWKFVGLMLI